MRSAVIADGNGRVWGRAAAGGGGTTSCRNLRRPVLTALLPCPCTQDLLPSELAARRGPSPMRPGGSPPRAPAPAAATSAPPLQHQASLPGAVEPVDGVPDATVDAWFALADADGDGRVADSEARDFFLTSGLAPADLSKARRLGEGSGGATRLHSCQALLVQLAETRSDLLRSQLLLLSPPPLPPPGPAPLSPAAATHV